MEATDYEGFMQTPSDDSLGKLAKLADMQAQRELIVNQAEEALKSAKEDLRLVSEVEIPELMESLGMETFTTTSGLKVKIKETIRASIPKENPTPAFNWLRENGHGSVIKRVVKLEFGKGQDKRADEAVQTLRSEGYDVSDEANVHFMTLGALAKELLTSGQDMPADLFGIHRQRVSKIG